MLAMEEPKVKGAEVRRLRKEMEISQQELAVEAKLSLGQVSRIENGRIERPQNRTLRNLARALGVDTKDLLDADSNGRNGS